MISRRKQRRGALLLVCLVLLILFLLLGITFILSAGSWNRSSTFHLRSKEHPDTSAQILDRVLMDFLRGSVDRSPYQHMNLLGDVYGQPALRGKLEFDASSSAGGQFMDLRVLPDMGFELNKIDHYYDGLVITMLSGDAKYQSRRVVGYNYDDSGASPVALLTITAFDPNTPTAGDFVLINGRPFSGTGHGYNRGTGSLGPEALEPNTMFYEPHDQYLMISGAGGNNEPYDAPDFNNPWLSFALAGARLSEEIKPSWHDPKLMAVAGQTRKNSFRPLGPLGADLRDHPEFTGGNPLFNPVYGPWDVDNDRDGLVESVWMDAGLPVQIWSDGRTVKPLVAMHIVALDGRVNINGSGSLRHTDSANYTGDIAGSNAFTAGGQPVKKYPTGLGYGPAEINPAWLLGDPSDSSDWQTGLNQLKALLQGDSSEGILGRYGDTPGASCRPGEPGTNDILSRLQLVHGYGGLAAYGTGHDFTGLGVVAIDPSGQGKSFQMGNASELTDDPYEQRLDATYIATTNDAPFTYTDFEILLRPSDIDSGNLPTRMFDLAPRLGGAHQLVTVSSWDMPVHPTILPPDIRTSSGDFAQRHIGDIIAARIVAEGNATIDTAYTRVNELIDKGVISPEMLAGLCFDVNRLFGNGLDDDGNGVVDDFAEVANELVYTGGIESALPAAFTGVPFNHDRDHPGVKDVKDQRVRQNYARQLYFLMMLLSDRLAYKQVIDPNNVEIAAGDNAKRKLLFARRMAQFAVNVVDFRDADSIMTPFEYDEDPFDGWDDGADGDLLNVATPAGNDTQVVWGMESQVLLMTESLATHNRNLADEDKDQEKDAATGTYTASSMIQGQDPADPHNTTNNNNQDTTYDSRGLPVGSLFLEFYCTATPYRTSPRRDLFTAGGQLDLARIPAGGNRPVWRVAISEPHVGPLDSVVTKYPDDSVVGRLVERPYSTSIQPEDMFWVDPKLTPTPPDDRIDIDRVVWFAPNTPPGGEGTKTYYNRTGAANTLLSPGDYLVVGPRQTTVLTQLTEGLANDTQYIKLNGNSIDVRNPDNSSDSLITGVKTIICASAPPAGVGWDGVNAPDRIGMNVSEPLAGSNYYPVTGAPGPNNLLGTLPGVKDFRYTHPSGGGGGGPAQVALDIPLDSVGGMPGLPGPGYEDSPVATLIQAEGAKERLTKLNYCTAFLQRLANPLLPWNPFPPDPDHDPGQEPNPYLTVDWMPIDLTVYNRTGEKPGALTDTVFFRTRARSDVNFNIWRPALVDPVAGKVSTHAFPHDLVQTLGYLNDMNVDTDHDPATDLSHIPANGKPVVPFPWLAWNDRPFVSQYELMQVPASSPGRLGFEYENAVFDYESATPNLAANPYDEYEKPFRHLLNFFHSDKNPAAGDSTQFGRVFDFLYVPSLYLGTRTVFNPAVFADPANNVGPFRPPYNVLSHYREPAKVNINMIDNPGVWAAVQDGHSGPSWAELVTSRRGYIPPDPYAPSAVLAHEDPSAAVPSASFFGNPFRPAVMWDLHPNASVSNYRDADASLLRSYLLVDPGFTPAYTHSMFATVVPDPANEQDAYHTRRNSFFRYQSINRLGNLVTTRSNVYAIWITVGYFEAEELSPADADVDRFPDGFRIGKEVGEDTGRTKRHRAFYIVDRSIPVAFEPGQDYNVEEIIRLRRHIE